jgi:hypothetical protein
MGDEATAQVAAQSLQDELIRDLYARSIPQARCEYWQTLLRRSIEENGVVALDSASAEVLSALLGEAWDAFNAAGDL